MRYIRNEGVVTGRVGEEMVMLDMEQGKYFGLNEVATAIWDLLKDPLTADELTVALTEEYEVDEGECRQAVEEWIGEMVRRGLVKAKDKRQK